MRTGNALARPLGSDSDTRTSRALSDGTVRERDGGNVRGTDAQIIPFRPRIEGLDNNSLSKEFNAAVRLDVGHHKNPTGRIAEAADCNIRTGENYLQGKNLPNVLQFLRIAASPEFPHVRKLVMELIGLEEQRDPLAEQKFNEFVQAWLGRDRV